MFRIARGACSTPLALMLTLLVVTSCGGDGGSVAPVDTGPRTGPVTETITPDGGTVTAYSAEGASFTLTFPQAAVGAPVSVTVRPLPLTGGLYALAALEPAGLVFYEPVDVVVTAPEETDLTDAQLMLSPGDETMYLTTSVDTGSRTLSTSLRFFGVRDDSLVVVPGGPVASSSSAQQTGGGNNLGAGAVDCAAIATSTQAAIDGLVNLGTQAGFRHALTLAINTASLLNQGNCAQQTDFVSQVGDLACQGLEQAIQDAAGSGTSTYGEFESQAEALIEWSGTAQQYSNTCTADYMSALSGEITDYVLFFNTRVGGLTNQDFATFQDLRGEAQTVFRLIVKCQMLGLLDAEQLLYDQVFYPTLDTMREVAYALCANYAWHYPLSRLTSTGFFSGRDIVAQPSPRPGNLISGLAPDGYAGFSDDDIYEDLEFAATHLEVVARATGGGQLDSTRTGGSGAPGQKTSLAAIDAPTRGTLKLRGTIPGFVCWDGAGADDEVVVKIDGITMRTLTIAPGEDYLAGGPVEIDIETAVAGGVRAAGGTTSKLTVHRKIPNCDYRLWSGEPNVEYKLLDATLNWQNPTLAVAVTHPDSVFEGTSSAVTVAVNVIDQFGTSTPTAGIDVTLNITGGTAQQTSGRTDASGKFTTSVTAIGVAASSAHGSAPGTAGMKITANATSYEGISKQATQDVTVRVCGASEGRFRESTGGGGTAVVSYGHARASGNAAAGQYSYGTTEFIDGFVVHVDDPALDGQRGYVTIKVRYRFKSTGHSESRPAARVVIGPRNGFSSPYFWENNFNTPSDGTARDIEEDWEIPISCTFNRSSAPLDVNCDAFARNENSACSVSAEVTWKGVTKITTADGTPVTNYWLCSASKTDWTLPQ